MAQKRSEQVDEAIYHALFYIHFNYMSSKWLVDVSILAMDIAGIFFLSVVVLLAGFGLVAALRAYLNHRRNRKAFNYNPWG
ncbi:hypothetical protein [Mariprofundus sp. EBB-1]|uniref:hypothetical protein n=1 Tax=Mariprofundus sp. EBB-1 TaxID=2650971 RepID=UPI0011C47235|nr:hypothetical protein [Mariprofundus sp. EBB-1]